MDTRSKTPAEGAHLLIVQRIERTGSVCGLIELHKADAAAGAL